MLTSCLWCSFLSNIRLLFMFKLTLQLLQFCLQKQSRHYPVCNEPWDTFFIKRQEKDTFVSCIRNGDSYVIPQCHNLPILYFVKVKNESLPLLRLFPVSVAHGLFSALPLVEASGRRQVHRT